MHHKRRAPRRKVRCSLCTPRSGNSAEPRRRGSLRAALRRLDARAGAGR